jgi:hypothetical protein
MEGPHWSRTFRSLSLPMLLMFLAAMSTPARGGSTWTGSGPGTATVVSDGSIHNPQFQYYFTGDPFWDPTWDFHTTADANGSETLPYCWRGFHAYYGVTAHLNAYVTHLGVTTVTPLVNDGPVNCCNPPSAGFHYTGTVTLNVQTGDTYGFQFGGKNKDTDWRLLGTFSVFSTNAPTCNAGGPYYLAAGATSIQLNGTGADPDNDLLTYQWTTDCPNATFDDPTSLTPVLTFTLGSVSTQQCTVTLTVDDGCDSSTASSVVHIPPQILCPQSTSISCAPASGLPVTFSVSVSDADPSQTLTITLKEGSTVLDTKSAATPATNLLVTFDPVLLSVMAHSLTIEVDDGTFTNSCNTLVTVDADTAPPVPDLTSLPTITGQCSASVSIVPTATDACAGKIKGTTSDPLSYNTQGTFTIHWAYGDGHGNTTHQTQTVIVQDTLAPIITACTTNQSVNATSPTGAVVNYPAAIATDNCASPTLSYSQAAGTLFPIGDTTVTVTATDAVGHQATCTFKVHVKGVNEQLSDLIAYVNALTLDSWTKVSLLSKLTAAQSALAAGNPQGALSALQDFINASLAQKGKKLTAAQANRLIADATRIMAVIRG